MVIVRYWTDIKTMIKTGTRMKLTLLAAAAMALCQAQAAEPAAASLAANLAASGDLPTVIITGLSLIHISEPTRPY